MFPTPSLVALPMCWIALFGFAGLYAAPTTSVFAQALPTAPVPQFERDATFPYWPADPLDSIQFHVDRSTSILNNTFVSQTEQTDRTESFARRMSFVDVNGDGYGDYLVGMPTAQDITSASLRGVIAILYGTSSPGSFPNIDILALPSQVTAGPKGYPFSTTNPQYGRALTPGPAANDDGTFNLFVSAFSDPLTVALTRILPGANNGQFPLGRPGFVNQGLDLSSCSLFALDSFHISDLKFYDAGDRTGMLFVGIPDGRRGDPIAFEAPPGAMCACPVSFPLNPDLGATDPFPISVSGDCQEIAAADWPNAPAVPEPSAFFGNSIAIDAANHRIAIGAPYASPNPGASAASEGTVYLANFSVSGGVLALTDKHTVSHTVGDLLVDGAPSTNALFGFDVAWLPDVSGDGNPDVFVSAPGLLPDITGNTPEHTPGLWILALDPTNQLLQAVNENGWGSGLDGSMTNRYLGQSIGVVSATTASVDVFVSILNSQAPLAADEGDFYQMRISRQPPSSSLIFVDDFDSGDTSAWSSP